MNDAKKLTALLDDFHITDRALLRARDRARQADDDLTAQQLRREIRRYFAAVERESLSLLSSIDRKLDDLYQRQYNVQAERTVAARRLDGARKMLVAAEDEVAGKA